MVLPMSTMSTDSVETAEGGQEPPQESLAERIARCPLPLLEALRYATEVAKALRELHKRGIAHGAVSSQLIILGESGAALGLTSNSSCLSDRCHDVTALGEVLDEMIGGDGAERDGSACLRQETHALALRCRNESPSIQHVLIDLRLLALQARQSGIVVRSAARQAVVWRM